jgi:hypothetical protein
LPLLLLADGSCLAQIVVPHSRFATNAAYWYASHDSPWTFAHQGRDTESNSLVWIDDEKSRILAAELVTLTVLRPSGGNQTPSPPTYTAYTNKTIARLKPGQGCIDFRFPELPPGVRHVRIYGFSTNLVADSTAHSGWVNGVAPDVRSVRQPLELQWEVNDGPAGETNRYRMLGFYVCSNRLFEVQRLYFAARGRTNSLTARLSLSTNSLVSLDVARLEFVEDLDFSRTNLWKTRPTTYTEAQRAQRIASAPGFSGEPWASWKGESPAFTAPTTGSVRSAFAGLWPCLNTTFGHNVSLVFNADSSGFEVTPRTPSSGIFGDWRYALAFTNGAGSTLTVTNWLAGTVPGYGGMQYDPSATNWMCGVARTFGAEGDYNGVYNRLRGLIGSSYAVANSGEKYTPFKRWHYFPEATSAVFHGWCALANYLALYPSINLERGVTEMLDNESPYLGYSFSSQTPRRKGRQEYDGWQGEIVNDMLQAIDYGWEYAATNRLLAEQLSLEWPFIDGDTTQVQRFLNRAFEGLVRDYDASIARGNPWTLGLVMQSGPDSARLMNAGLTSYNVVPDGGGAAKHQYASSISQQGTHYIGSTMYMTDGKMSDAFDTFTLYKLGGGTALFDLSNLSSYPKIAAWADLVATLAVANGYIPDFGDASYTSGQGPLNRASNWQRDWRLLQAAGSPNRFRMAKYLRDVAGRGDLSEADWAEVTNEAARAAFDIRRAEESRVLPGIGLAILETGLGSTQDMDRAALVLKTGIGYGHDHSDHLDLNYFALKARILPDFGVRDEGSMLMYPYGYVQDVHNVVSVGSWDDPRAVLTEGSNSGNWLFSPGGSAQVMAAELWPKAGLPVSSHSRLVAMVAAGSNTYAAGVQRVRATTNGVCWNFGTTHMGPGTNDFSCSISLDRLPGEGDPGTMSYKFRKHAFTNDYWPAANIEKAHAVLEFRWKLSSAAASRGEIRNRDGNGGAVSCVNAAANMGAATNTFLTVRLFDRTNDCVATADAFSSNYSFLTRRAYVFPSPGGPPADTAYLELIAPHAGPNFITCSESLPVSGFPENSDAVKALKVQGAGFTDYHFFGPADSNAPAVAGGMTCNGAYGFYRADSNNAFVQMKLVGGSGFTNGAYALSPSSRWTGGTVTNIDYRANTFEAVDWVGVRKPGWYRFHNASHHAEYVVTHFTGNRMTWRNDALIGTADVADSYTSGVSIATDQASLPVLDYPRRRTGVTFVNESGTRWFRGNAAATLTCTDGQQVTGADFTDDDGDGWEEARIYDFGNGDRADTASEAVLTADGPARWKLAANAGLTITVPGQPGQRLFLDGTALDTRCSGELLSAVIEPSRLTGDPQLLETGSPGGLFIIKGGCRR